MKRRSFIVLLLGIFISQSVFAAWPTASSRSKDWGNEVLTDSDLEAQFDLLHTYNNDQLNASTGHKHQGTTNDGPKIPINSSLTIASQAQGDVIYASSNTAWARLGAGTTGQFLKTNGTGANPAWSNVIIKHYRREMECSQASSTTITVRTGELEVGGNAIEKTSDTTLTLTTAGNWAGGVSLQATSTYGYIGVDSSGNVKMHTTAPTHSDYGVSSTTGTKRYVTWSGTVYRVIGWFYMNAVGSGELYSYEVGNIKEMGVRNLTQMTDTTSESSSSTSYSDMGPTTGIHFFAPSQKIRVGYNFRMAQLNNGEYGYMIISVDGTEKSESEVMQQSSTVTSAAGYYRPVTIWTGTTAARTIAIKSRLKAGNGAYTTYVVHKNIEIEEL